ncbi:unnamed protein product, partial [marine sediment metagenome]
RESRPKTVGQIAGLAKKIFAWRNKTRKAVAKADKLAENGKFKAACKIYEDTVKKDKSYTVIVHRTWDAIVEKDLVDGFYFPDVPDKIDGLDGLAQERLKKAKEHYDKKEYAEAEKLLEPMVRDKFDHEAVKKAGKLLEKVKEAKESGKK